MERISVTLVKMPDWLIVNQTRFSLLFSTEAFALFDWLSIAYFRMLMTTNANSIDWQSIFSQLEHSQKPLRNNRFCPKVDDCPDNRIYFTWVVVAERENNVRTVTRNSVCSNLPFHPPPSSMICLAIFVYHTPNQLPHNKLIINDLSVTGFLS